ncbi:MAG: redoxin domain-containing protein [Candidatus Acidiferrum sp.]
MLELEALQTVLPQIKQAGATLVAVSPQLAQYSGMAKQRSRIEFDILTDLHQKLSESLGLVFALPDYLVPLYRQFGATLDVFHDEPGYRLPMAARYVIDRGGIIRSAEVNADYTIRPEPEETVEALKRIS